MSTAIEKVLEIAASNSFDNASVQTCLTAVSDLSNNMDTRMQAKVDAIIDSAPGALDTLNELAAALGDDANFATTVTNSLSQKQANITASTDLTLNDISGNNVKFSDISGVNFFTTGGTFIGNLTGNATTATSATTAGTVTTAAQPNITSVGTLTSLTVSGDLSGNDASFNNVDITAAALNSLTVDGVSVSKTLHVSSSNLSSQVYYENFDAEDVTIHTDSEMTYVTGRDGTGKALNTVGVTPVGLQWVQTLPSGRKAFSFWLKIPSLSSTSNAFDAIILDGRNGSGTGYLMVYYKGGKMYINTSDNAENKLPTKFLIDGTAATLGSWDSTEGKQVGTGQYLQDNSWHHWYLELSTNDTTPSLSWFSGYQVISNETPSSWSQQKKITTTDTATRSFGGGHSQCIATYGDYFAVGDWRTNNSTGAVYLFKKNQGGANNWGQIKKLEASDGAENDRFGFSVDMYGDYIVVGSPYDDDVQGDSGSIYIFKKDQGGTDNWGQLVKRTAEPANSYTEFGFSVAIYDEYIAVGEQSSPNGGSSRGAAYIFEKDISGTDAWGLVKKITSSDSANSDKFGSSIAINGTNVVVGAKGETGSEGALYVFEKDEGGTDNWGEVQKLVANDGASADLLGESVGIYGNYIVSGARGDDDAGNSSGSAYVFKNQSGTWSQIKKLTAGDAAASDSFGVSVSIDGNYIIVGSKGDGDNGISSGSAYIFSKDISGSDAWGQVKKITSDDGVASDAFGRSVVIRGLNIFVISSGNIAKAAYLFSNSTINSTSFFNLEAVVDDYRIFNTSLTDPQINNLSVGGNGNVLGNAIVVPRLDAVDVSCNGIVVTGDISGNDASFNNVDIVGLAVSSLTVGGTTIDTNGSTPINIATTSVSDLSDVSFNTVSSGQVLSWNTAGYFEPTTQTSSGNLNSNSDLSLNNLETTDISSGSISTPSLTTSGTTALGGHIIPDTNSQYDLGSAEYKIRHLFLSNNSLWLGDQHKIDVSGGKMRFKKRKIGTGFVPQEILDASGGSTASEHINAVIAKFGDVTDADDIELHHWYEYIQDPVASGITAGTLLPHQIFLKDDNFAENKDLMNDVKLPVKTDAGAPSTTPATGTMVFNSSDNKLYIYNGGWRYVDTTAV